jgi:hypothetical protein
MGDPFFVATLPDNPESAFGDVAKVSEGVYEVNLGGETVVIDDFVPAVDGEPQFTKSADGLMWPLLYEKAMAKKAGCYDALSTIRRGGMAPNTPSIESLKLPADATPSARRAYAIKEFLSSSLSAAALSGHERVLDEFSTFFKDTPKPAQFLDGLARAMSSVGSYEKYSFPLRTPALSVKVNSDTMLHVEASRADALDGKMVVCVCEVGPASWKMLRGKVAQPDEQTVDLDVFLPATANNFIVFVGTPVSQAAVADIALNVSSDKEIQIDMA